MFSYPKVTIEALQGAKYSTELNKYAFMNTILVAAAIVYHEGKILLTQRPSGTHLEGYWEFPGGKVEEGEDPQDAVVRECFEECGIRVKPQSVMDVIFHRYPNKHVLLIFYECVLQSGEVEHRHIRDHVWCAPTELRQYKLPPADDRVVERLVSRR